MLRIKKAKVASLRKANKAAPKPLERILEKALHHKPHKRYPTAADFLKDVEAFQATATVAFTPEILVQYLVSTLS